VMAYLIAGIGFGLYIPVIAAMIFERTTPLARGRAIGFMTSGMLFSNFANPFLIAPLRNTFNLQVAFIVVGLTIAIVGVALTLLLAVNRDRSATAQPVAFH
jgi:MFS family permease